MALLCVYTMHNLFAQPTQKFTNLKVFKGSSDAKRETLKEYYL